MFINPQMENTNLSVEHRLYVDLPRKIKLLCGRLGPFVPLFEDLAETCCVYLDELLGWQSCS